MKKFFMDADATRISQRSGPILTLSDANMKVQPLLAEIDHLQQEYKVVGQLLSNLSAKHAETRELLKEAQYAVQRIILTEQSDILVKMHKDLWERINIALNF
jgi:hypothetical protein